jgi:hypothetical protein
MPVSFTPRLAEGRRAQLDLGPAGARDCRITGFAGAQVFLAVDDALFADGDAHAGYLLLDGGDEHLQAVRGRVVRGGPGVAVMHLADPFSGQRRTFSRAPLVLPVGVRGEDGDEWDTVTRDISAGGLALARQPAWHGERRATLTVRVGSEVRFSAEAEVRRVSAASLGMSFTRIADTHRALLAELALAYHRA